MARSSLALLAALACLIPANGRAGCLAPRDSVIDVPAEASPMWGNDAGSLLYARQGSAGHPVLVLRRGAGSVDEVATEGQSNEFFVGVDHERWVKFHTASLNLAGDLAFVASTTIPDDPATPANEAIARRGAYARSGRQLFRVARFGEPSPIRDLFNVPVPWGSLSDAVVADADDQGYLRVVFSGQLLGEFDRRSGLFRWSEAAANTSTAVLLTGDAAPSGGNFTAFGRLRSTPAGDVVFFAVTQTSETAPQVPGIFLLRPDGSRARIVKFGTAGDTAPGGGTFGIAADFDVDAAGVVHFAASLVDAPAKTALFRARPPQFVPEFVLAEGTPTPLSGTFGSFARATIRVNVGGEVVLSAPLGGDVEGDGLFTIPADGVVPLPLVVEDSIASAAAIGPGRAAVTTLDTVRIVVPSDGSEQGPTDFRVAKLDLRNAVASRADSLTVEGRFLLAPWGVAPPATFRGDATRFTPTASLSGAALTKLVEVKLFTSSSPGNNFVFGVAGTDAAPTGTVTLNGTVMQVKSLKIAPDGTSVVWKFSGTLGAGTFTVNLLTGTFSLKVTSATLREKYDAPNFRVAFVLRSEADLAQSRADADSFFRRDIRLDGQQPSFGSGRRVTSQGENTPGGTLFVDSIRVARKAAKGVKPAADSIQLAGTLRLCPGAALPATAKITATLRLGDFLLDAIEMTRSGSSASYRYSADGADLSVDLAAGTFALKVKALPPLGQLASAVAGSPTNGPELTVGGMQLDFTLSILRVYDASFVVPVVRLPKGTLFQR